MMHRCAALVATLVLALLGALAPSASAATRTGTVKDAAGDSSAGGPSLDIVSARFGYDSDGSLVVSATMAGPFNKPTSTRMSPVRFELHGHDAKGVCTESASTWVAASTTANGTFVAVTENFRTGPNIRGDAVFGGNSVTIRAQDAALAGKDLVCMRVLTTDAVSDNNSHGADRAFVVAAGFNRDLDRDGKRDPAGPAILVFPKLAATVSRSLSITASSEDAGTATISLRSAKKIRLPGATRAAIANLGSDSAAFDGRRSSDFKLRLPKPVQAYLEDKFRLSAIATVTFKPKTGGTFVRRFDVVVRAPGE